MKVTVLTSVYNTPKQFLTEAINSILNQTHKDFEFIIVDDGSNIETKEVLRSFKDERISLIEFDVNKGAGYALNEGIDKSTGDIIIKMDGDDLALPTLIERHLLNFTENTEIKICGVQIKAFGEQQYVTDHPKIITAKLAYERNNFWFVNHPGIAYTRSAIFDVNKYSLNGEDKEPIDYAIYIKWLCKGYLIYNLPDVLINYRTWNGSISGERRKAECKNITKRLNILKYKLQGVL